MKKELAQFPAANKRWIGFAAPAFVSLHRGKANARDNGAKLGCIRLNRQPACAIAAAWQDTLPAFV